MGEVLLLGIYIAVFVLASVSLLNLLASFWLRMQKRQKKTIVKQIKEVFEKRKAA